MNKVKSKKRKVVEIYFILYLAALILLIPDKDEVNNDNTGNGQQTSIYNFDFSLKPLKNSLNCTLVLDSGKIKLLSIDSLNKIYYSGKVKDVKFSFNIKDKGLQNAINLKNDNNNTKYFSFQDFPDEQMAEFKWFPPLRQRKNKTYVVEAVATAISTEKGVTIQEKTQFTLNVEFVNDYRFADASDISDTLFSEEENSSNMQNFIATPNYGDYSLSPKQEVIKKLALTEWENIIYAFKIDLKHDLLRNPKIEIKGQGLNSRIRELLSYEIIDNNSMKITGLTPEYGSATISVSIIRDYDRKSITEEFTIEALMLGDADYAEIMYPEIKYNIKPNLPLTTSSTTVALLKNDNNDTLAISNRGGEFLYTPNHDDTLNNIYLERFIDGRLIGQRNSINVKSYPAPQILSPTVPSNYDGKKVEIYTLSKGTINGKENYVTDLIIEGNAKYRELTGSETIDFKNMNIKQRFEILPKDPSKPFVFKVRAKNENGKVSSNITWPQI